jgi:hypothetical protein
MFYRKKISDTLVNGLLSACCIIIVIIIIVPSSSSSSSCDPLLFFPILIFHVEPSELGSFFLAFFVIVQSASL